jgi:hypothetical protein
MIFIYVLAVRYVELPGSGDVMFSPLQPVPNMGRGKSAWSVGITNGNHPSDIGLGFRKELDDIYTQLLLLLCTCSPK